MIVVSEVPLAWGVKAVLLVRKKVANATVAPAKINKRMIGRIPPFCVTF